MYNSVKSDFSGYTAFTSHQYLSSNESGTILKCFELHHSLLVTSYSLSDFDIVWTKDNKIIQNSTEASLVYFL